jgi:hypothetical protein
MTTEVLKITLLRVEKCKDGIEHPLITFRSNDSLKTWSDHITEVLINELRKVGDDEKILVELITREKPDVEK